MDPEERFEPAGSCGDWSFFERETPADFLADIKTRSGKYMESEIVDDARKALGRCLALERREVFGPVRRRFERKRVLHQADFIGVLFRCKTAAH
jgi:hypothetical protein